jgi:hypothetical protein
MSNWNQPICFRCWDQRHPEGRVPVRATPPQQEKCAYCGTPTISGIYVRDDPATVKYPAPLVDGHE